MAIPDQIRKQTEAVQDLYKQLNDGEAGEATAASEQESDQEAANNSYPADENSYGEFEATSSATEQKVEGNKQSEESILQKYKTLQGMYNAEVPRLHSQNREMQQRVQQMEELLATLSQNTAANAGYNNAYESYISQDDVDEYGETLDVMRKVSREELNPVAQRLANIEAALQQMQVSVVPQIQAVTRNQQASAEQQFWSSLSEQVPNWRDINDSPDFQSWLLGLDPLTGLTRQTYLEDAQRVLDPNRVGAFFRTWLAASGNSFVAHPAGFATSSELERQVAPGRSRGAGTPSTSAARTYTPDDIKNFFNDVRIGKYKGREKERDRIERDIFAAQKDNRIQANA